MNKISFPSTATRILAGLSSTAMALTLAVVVTPFTGGVGYSQEIESSIARGGQLYDKWYAVIGAEKPTETHPAWPASNEKKSGDATQRCKACHGWDLRGADGAYKSGSYKTGIAGLTGFAGGDNATVIAAIKDNTHGFTGMSDRDYTDLANFVTKGQFDIAAVINDETKAATGDAAKGEAYYNTVCSNCHGVDGKLPKDLENSLGALARGNPWEIIQKIQNGQPAEKMPAMRAFGVETSAAVLAYLQTLPE